ncbi:MAG TPA: PD-(D/E)XK nuclease family protein [Bryobacteraceae bacterium]|nr:PD-(D/E)XK nuclease family protein [Bryobacteraceae bacterium]
MRLIVGPAGSGKTTLVLNQLREAVRAGNHAVRLLVPTATMAQHLQNQVAREGLLLRPRLIQTLSAFVREWCGEARQAPQAVVYLVVEDAVRRAGRPEFSSVADTPGFCASLARTMEELASAGCRAVRLRNALPDAPLAAGFLALYEEVEQQLENRGMALRGRRLERAAQRIATDGAGGIAAIWLDGFHALPDPELGIIAALGRRTELTLTASETDLSEAMRIRLADMGFREEPVTRSRPAPAVALVKAANIERECEEIARRILEQAAAGRPFREMGIVVRTADVYVPVLRTTLERFAVPARFYFDEPLERHPVARFLAGTVDAMLGGWEHAATLPVLRLAPRFADSDAMDRFDFAVRDQLPSSGLAALKELARESFAERLEPLLDRLGALEEWRALALAPKDWVERLAQLRLLFRPHVALPASHELALQWRSQAEALDLFDDALEEAALAVPEPAREIPLEPFWRMVKSVLRLKVLRLEDQRRNVVHVLSAPEARQWVLPVVFVCGLVEKQFPRFHPQDPFFPDAARCALNEAGIRVRTVAEFEREERALFDAAVSRATLLTTLSYPEFDNRGERNLRSLYLEDLPLAAECARLVAPGPEGAPLPPASRSGRKTVTATDLLEALRTKTARLGPTALESYLQCPFQFFGRYTLRLKTRPLAPEHRLDFLTQGIIVHEALKCWYAEARDIVELFARIFAAAADEKRIPRSYRTERLRNLMLDDLKAFAADDQWPREGWRSRLEEPFTLALEAGLEIAGKIDRLDVAEDGRAYVFDYKYSNPQNTRGRRKSELLLQAPLYLLAAQRCFGARPAGMFYIGLKGAVAYEGWSADGLLKGEPLPENWLELAAGRSLRAVEEIRAGRVEPAPAEPEKCRFCDCRDVCRVSVGQAEALAEGA